MRCLKGKAEQKASPSDVWLKICPFGLIDPHWLKGKKLTIVALSRHFEALKRGFSWVVILEG